MLRMINQGKIKLYFFWGALVFAALFACESTGYQPAALSDEELVKAKLQIDSFDVPSPRNLSSAEAKADFERLVLELYPSALFVCSSVGLRSSFDCGWDFEIVENDEFNAFASGRNEITFFDGLIKAVTFEEELSFVIAHEISHHIAGHYQKTVSNVNKGAMLGAVLGAAIASSTDNEEEQLEILQDAVEVGANLGNLSFSIAQEREADLLALEILRHAGVNLTKARYVIPRMQRLGGSKSARSSFLDTHPTNVERLAAFDATAAEKGLFEGATAATEFSEPAGARGTLSNVLGSYCVYDVDGRKEAVLKSVGCPQVFYFPSKRQ